MPWWNAARKLRAGQQVRFRALGSSMSPTIRSFQPVEVWPVRPELVETGDIVAAEVGGRTFLHRVSRVDGGRVEIADARGRVNGWRGYEGLLGICVSIGGRPVPSAAAKAR